MPPSQVPLSICRTCLRTALRRQTRSPLQTLSIRAASASSTKDPNKPIVLEQPDKFRPPSHPQRLSRRPRMSGYNQGTTERERQQQKTRSYPHMFPNEGTFMHWFLTNRLIHLWITLGTLAVLASISLTTSFLRTSPFAHLLPELHTLPFHPITFVSETISVLRMHMEYQTEQTAELRQRNILDAQKRRVYRRAHGMENLDAEEEQGIDVRGIAPWDDGLTNRERAQGGREEKKSLAEMLETGKANEDAQAKAEGAEAPDTQTPPPPQRKRKLWLGIW